MTSIQWHPGLELVHDPEQIDDYVMGFAAWLGIDTLSTATVMPTGGLSAVIGTIDPAGDVPFRVSGGTPGLPAQVTVRATSSSGRVLDRTIRFRVMHT